MAEIIRRGQEPSLLAPQREWEPLRWFRDMMRFDPFREMFPTAPTGAARFLPDFDVKETANSYVFRADLPGVKEGDLEITITGNRLNISGKREMEEVKEDESYYYAERAYGSFTRTFTLPEGVDPDKVKVELKDGVLTVVAPKRPEVQPKRIPIQVKKS